jgi:hypothetical protein
VFGSERTGWKTEELESVSTLGNNTGTTWEPRYYSYNVVANILRCTYLQQNSDGTIASVYFDFVFLADGKETNRGSETWVLVRGTDGWRIAGMTYSSTPPMP